MSVLQMLNAFAIGICIGSVIGNVVLENYGMALIFFGLLVVNVVARGLTS